MFAYVVTTRNKIEYLDLEPSRYGYGYYVSIKKHTQHKNTRIFENEKDAKEYLKDWAKKRICKLRKQINNFHKILDDIE
jgi:hypothetical protein